MKESEYFRSEEFKELFTKQVEEDTWGKGLPKIYMDKEGRIVKHFKDSVINVLKEAVEKTSVLDFLREKELKEGDILKRKHPLIVKQDRVLNNLDEDYRIIHRDGTDYVITDDLSLERLNITINNGIITEVTYG